MRITFVIPYFYPAWQYGGTPRVAFELARALAARGHQIKVLTTDSGGVRRLPAVKWKSPVVVEGIEVFYFPNLSNYLAFRHRLFLPFGFARRLKAELNDCDILHIHEFRSTLAVPSYSAARKRRIPYVVSPHGGLMHLGKRRAKRMFDRLWGYSILENASVLAAVSPLEYRDALTFKVDASRIRLLPNALCPEDYEQLPERGKFKSKWGIRRKKLILFLARLHWIKGADILVEAFARLLERHDDLHLAIAGPDDGQEHELRRMVAATRIENHVTFPGYLNEHDKREAMVDSDVLVIPSRSEVFAITALEGMMCGLPIVLSSACGLAPMPPADCGVRLFETGKIDDLVEKLACTILQDKKDQNSAGCRTFVAKEFSPGAIAQQAEALYQEIVSRGQGHR